MALQTGAPYKTTTTTVAAAEPAAPVTAASQPAELEDSTAERSLLGADHHGHDSSYFQGNHQMHGQYAYGECLRQRVKLPGCVLGGPAWQVAAA
jgi:hypothetical protein